jgi:hypothetical protein
MSDQEIKDALEIRSQFMEGWNRSARGNLTREWDNKTLTIFKRGAGYSWSISRADEVVIEGLAERIRFAKQGYESESLAMSALWSEFSPDVLY